MADRSPHLAARRPTHPLWWFHRHINEDQFTDMLAALTHTETELVGDKAAERADTEYLYLAPGQRARIIADATLAAQETLRLEVTAAIEHYVAARLAHADEQRQLHIRAHHCNPNTCNTLRGPTR